MKLLLLLLITVAIVADGAESLKCYDGHLDTETEEATSLKKKECEEGAFCKKNVFGMYSELIG